MNTIFVVIFALIVVAIPSAQAVAPSMNATITVQDPFPAEPGRTVSIEIEIQNNGKGEATEVTVELMEQPPFTLVPGEERIKTFSIIKPKSSVKEGYVLLIDDNAVTSTYDIEFRIGIDQAFILEKIPIVVQGTPKMIIEEISLENVAEAGGQVGVSISVKNVGTGAARHVTLELNASEELIPLLSEGTSYLGTLNPNDNISSTVHLTIDDSAEETTYVMKLHVTYEDESGTEVKKDFEIGIPVQGTVKLDILKVEPNSQRQQLEIEVANKGTTEATSVEARLFKDGELVDLDYISQIKPTKKTTFAFPLVSGGEGVLEIHFTGPGLKESVVTKDLVFDYQVNGNSDSSGTTVLIVIIIVIIVTYFWRRRRSKKTSARRSA